jgi:octaprenyl-diphosphate synthase
VNASVEALRLPIADDLAAVDQCIRDRLSSDVPLIAQVAEYIIAAGGKRLRPALVLLAARACGYGGADHVELAAVVEFIHTATLLHDDVVDESDLRRGRETANARFGNAASVLVGDFLYSRSFQLLVGVGNMRVMQVLAEATNTIAEGEVLQLLNISNADVDRERYLAVIARKTAKLFEAAARLGAILAGADARVEAALARYGAHLGVAFQLVDDALDYSGDPAETGKAVGGDLAEGKPTLPLIHVMQQGTADERALVRHAIETRSIDQLPAVSSAIERTGAIAATRAAARVEADAARALLEALPDSPWRQTLIDLAVFSVDRSF